MRTSILRSLLLAGGLLAAGVSLSVAQPAPPPTQGEHRPGEHPAPSPIARAVAVLLPAAGSSVQGTVTFETLPEGTRVVADISGLSPGKHGFHVHEFGDLRAADFSSAGPHFMAPGQAHGAPGQAMSHRGDLGNLVADAMGHAHLEVVSAQILLNGPGSVLGRSVVVHADEDDLATQPTGKSGARVACGVIGRAQG